MLRTLGEPAKRHRFGVRLALGAIVTVTFAVSAMWVFAIPFMQEPDEAAHADYVLTLFSKGHLVRARDGHRGWDVTPAVRYLEQAASFRTVRYNPYGRVSPGYGTPSFYKVLDRNAPSNDVRTPDIPYVIYDYPFGFYAADAIAARVGWMVSGKALTSGFFAARFLCSLCLCITVVLTYFVSKALSASTMVSLSSALVIGTLPLSSWVTAYVQPDAAALPLVTAAVLIALRGRRHFNNRSAAALAAVVGGLVLVKPHIAFAVAATLVPFALTRSARSWRTRLARATFVVVPALVLEPVTLYYSWSRSGMVTVEPFITAALRSAVANGPVALLHYCSDSIGQFVSFFFLGGTGMEMFWHRFSWIGAPIVFYDGTITGFIMSLIGSLTLLIAALMIVRQIAVLFKVLRVWRRRSAATAARIIAGDVALNVYFAWFALLLFLSVYSNGTFTHAGRYWLVALVPTVLIPLHYAWRPLPVKARAVGRNAFSIATVAFCVVAVACEPSAIRNRFYGTSPRGSDEWLAHIEQMSQAGRTIVGLDNPDIRPHVRLYPYLPISLVGWAADSRAAGPPRSVAITLDGRVVRASVERRTRSDIAIRWNEPNFQNTGFVATIAARDARPGPHVLAVEIVGHDGKRYRSIQQVPIDLRIARDPVRSSSERHIL